MEGPWQSQKQIIPLQTVLGNVSGKHL